MSPTSTPTLVSDDVAMMLIQAYDFSHIGIRDEGIG
jgi:hypothetical protein